MISRLCLHARALAGQIIALIARDIDPTGMCFVHMYSFITGHYVGKGDAGSVCHENKFCTNSGYHLDFYLAKPVRCAPIQHLSMSTVHESNQLSRLVKLEQEG